MKKFSKLTIMFFMGCVILFGCKEIKEKEIVSETNQKSTLQHFSTVVASVVNENIVFPGNINDMITNWENVINNDPNLSLDFDNYYIEQNDGKYFIISKDLTSNSTSAIALVLLNGNFYEVSYSGVSMSSQNIGTTCTCSGCESTGPGSGKECQPKGDDFGWYCTDCSQGTCTKSITIQVGGVLSK